MVRAFSSRAVMCGFHQLVLKSGFVPVEVCTDLWECLISHRRGASPSQLLKEVADEGETARSQCQPEGIGCPRTREVIPGTHLQECRRACEYDYFLMLFLKIPFPVAGLH